MELFYGRQDVFAKRFVSKSSGKTGYSPVCGNQWVTGLCEIPKVKCNSCPNKKLAPLTAKVIDAHLRGKDPLGRDVVGVYPMLPDETCKFLVADFDDENWLDDITVFREACLEHGLNVAVERSRSGNGGHVWFFFEEPISCALARRLGSGLLTAAMETRHVLSFSSYDRFLPNQDTMPSGGYGNLIALPLQGLARKSSNSEFIDKYFTPYPDQWAYLSSLSKIPLTTAEELSQKFAQVGDLGVLAEPETSAKPWTKKPDPVPLFSSDFPSTVKLTRANGIYLNKHQCSERALTRIKRLAAFKNPEFFKAQAMRFPTSKFPRIICTAWETDDYLCLPRGLEGELVALLEKAGASCTIDDQTEANVPIKVSFIGELREDQDLAAKALLSKKNGVLSATTAFGKTVTAAYLIAQIKVNTLILVHTQALMNQWLNSLEKFLQVDEALPEPIQVGRGRKKLHTLPGCLGGGKNNLTGIIDVAIVASLANKDEVKPLVKDYGLVIVDECHHVPAVRFEKVMSQVTARYIYGLSATPIRQDGHHPIIFQQCGPILHRVDAKEQSIARGFSHVLIPRFTRFRKPITEPEKWPITDIYAALSQSKTRNDLIIEDVSQAVANNRTPLIITERVEHARELSLALEKEIDGGKVFLLTGQGRSKEKQAILTELRQFTSDQPLVIVATGKYAGEGFDEPRLDTLFVTMPIAWKGTVSQYAGRLHRLYEGKQDVIVYDYVDVHVPVLEKMYHKRLTAYCSLGYSVQATTVEADQKTASIYNQESFSSVFTKDLQEAQKEILIVSPFLTKSRVNQMKPLLLSSLANGASTIILTRPTDSFSDSTRPKIIDLVTELNSSGLTVIHKDGIHQKFSIIDRRIVWYGSINLLSYGKSEETMMRFENREIAEELFLDIEKELPDLSQKKADSPATKNP
jgi:superfamily II DNA or RNA helicase